MATGTLTQTHITIVGLGLMGGSLALALRGKCAGMMGVDIDAETRQRAVERRVVEFATGDFTKGVARAELLILATPVRTILAQLERLAALPPQNARSNPLPILDLGSTKLDITRAMAALPNHYDPLGGHPMCGKEVPGLNSADAALFSEATFALTLLERTTPETQSLARELVQAVGAHPLLLDPARHDRLVAMTSHLPYLLSCGLTAAAAEQASNDELLWALAASGFRDTTRLAAGDVRVMADILLTNRKFVRESLKRQRTALDRLMVLLEGDESGLQTALQDIRMQRLAHVKV